MSGFDGWSDQACATLTRLINDETRTGFKIEMWINGDVRVTDPTVNIRDLDWFLMRLRQVASASDYAKIAECVATARAEVAQGIEAATAGETSGSTVGESPVPQECAQGDAP